MKTGRRASIPDSVIGEVGKWHREGVGCRRISKLLEKHQVYTTRGSVHRLLTNQPPYESVPAANRNMTLAEMRAELAKIREELEALPAQRAKERRA